MPTWLVTGGSGFLGRHMLDVLRDQGGVVALGRKCPAGWPAGAFVRADLDDRKELGRLIQNRKPGVVFHLAGRTPPTDPAGLYRANTRGTVHLLDALKARGEAVRVV